jgi:NAD(P)-dependent dehydrogenase (short-subunit alcohol dehydrogenase family)
MKIQNLFDLSGKTALVTGGGRGIGKFIADGLAEAGADVIVASRKVEVCEKQAEEIKKLGVKGYALGVDMGSEESIGKLVEEALKLTNKIDILVNNAGITWGTPSMDFPLKAWDKVMGINLRGLWILTQKIGNHMKDNDGGNVINLASVMGMRGAPEESQPAVAYNASKAAVINLTRDLAVKWARYKIRVNAIAPGFFATDMMAFIEAPEFAEVKKQILINVPLGRVGQADDMKGVAVFLASNASGYVSGETLVVDGGMIAK